jgi:hypothetical protein
MRKEKEDMRHFVQAPMSDIWRELLGSSPSEIETTAPDEEVPLLKSDPWSELLQSGGIEIINVQQVHLDMSELDVEQALQVMQEDSIRDASSEQ